MTQKELTAHFWRRLRTLQNELEEAARCGAHMEAVLLAEQIRGLKDFGDCIDLPKCETFDDAPAPRRFPATGEFSGDGTIATGEFPDEGTTGTRTAGSDVLL